MRSAEAACPDATIRRRVPTRPSDRSPWCNSKEHGDRRPMRSVAKANIFAAGAVLWRRPARRARTASRSRSIHRPRYDDWSLPKGKVDPGETEAVTAVREIVEETGFRAQLGRRLMSVGYPVEQSVKKVVYWAARAGERRFRAQPRGRQTALAACRRRDERRCPMPTTGRCCAGSPDNRPTPARC